MKLTVLGSASGYVPKDQPYRFPSTHLVQTENKNILLDTGVGAMPQLSKLGLTIHDIDVFVISHFHHDHFVIGPIMQAIFLEEKRARTGRQVVFIGPEGLMQNCKTVFDIANSFDEDFSTVMNVEFIESLDVVNVDGVKIQAFKTDHYGLEARSYRIESGGKVLAYSGDSTDTEGLRSASIHADILLCEAVKDGQENDTGHLSSYGAGVIARDVGAKQLILTHYPGTDPAESMLKAVRDAGFTGDADVSVDMSKYSV